MILHMRLERKEQTICFFKVKADEFSSFVIIFSIKFLSKTMPMTLVVPMVVKAMILHSVWVVVGALSGHTC